ncbi:TetR/AcrR family transcriptional regulator [Pseudarthrobacter sp. P1]|uniref:SACE_7040 family transcriptional regulator n=1 Tax=Pseudarthrobacter sp. P1 TaxID=3418418 RepID=UPI003CF2D393
MSQELPTRRSEAKASRRRAMLDAAAALFAQRGFSRVSIEDLGAAAGVSGPAVYRHFSGKQALLGALLVDVSEELLAGGRTVLAGTDDDGAALRSLITFHVDFALANTDVIRVQDRDLDNLSPADHKQVRTLQRSYVELWVDLLGRLDPATDPAALRIKAHAVFGLINSTPHSLQMHGRRIGAKAARPVLEQMAWASLAAPAC